MDFERVKRGYAFLSKHSKTVTRILGTSSLASTYAARDVAPVLMQTQRLPADFNQRMKETEAQMFKILFPPSDGETFLKRSYAQAITLGQMHVDVAKAVQAQLAWNPKERTAMNGQSFAFVLYSFAWWPVEAMLATKEIDATTDAQGIEDWFYLWSVIGYGMGVPEPLLPMSTAQATSVIELLRVSQYARPGEKPPVGIPTLLGAHVRQLAGRAAAAAKTTPEAETAGAAKLLADSISYSPGLTEALGLGSDPVARLIEYSKK